MSPTKCFTCQEPAVYYIVYGCLNLHVSETALCLNHAAELTNNIVHNQKNCLKLSCPLKAADFEWCFQDHLTGKITTGELNALP